MKMSKKLLTTVAALSLGAFIVQSPQTVSAASPISPTASSGTEISPLADVIKWVYYTAEDGKMYKRLFNASTGAWIGDWIYVSG